LVLQKLKFKSFSNWMMVICFFFQFISAHSSNWPIQFRKPRHLKVELWYHNEMVLLTYDFFLGRIVVETIDEGVTPICAEFSSWRVICS
jgi:hypothetical protein